MQSKRRKGTVFHEDQEERREREGERIHSIELECRTVRIVTKGTEERKREKESESRRRIQVKKKTDRQKKEFLPTWREEEEEERRRGEKKRRKEGMAGVRA